MEKIVGTLSTQDYFTFVVVHDGGVVASTEGSKLVYVYSYVSEGDSFLLEKTIPTLHKSVTAIAISGNDLVTGGSEGCVYSYTLNQEDNMQQEGATGDEEIKRNLLLRVPNEITYLQFNSAFGKLLAVCSRTDMITLRDIDTEETTTLESNVEGGFLTCSFDPQTQYLSAVGIDNSLVIWSNLLSKPQVVYQSSNAISKDINRLWAKVSKRNLPLQIAWYPQGRYLAMPSKYRYEVNVVPRGKWKKPISVKHDSFGYPYIVKYSPNGLYLLVVSTENLAIVALNARNQELASEVLVYHQELDSVVSAAEWSSSSDQIYVSKLNGSFTAVAIQPTVGSTYKHSANTVLVEDVQEEEEELEIALIPTEKKELLIEEEPIKEVPATPKKSSNSQQLFEPEPAVQTIPAEEIQPAPKKEIKVQAFQPNATEFIQKGNTYSRYLVYNQIGKVVASHNTTQTASLTIQVNLLDVTKGGHKNYEDFHKPHLAALSEHGVVFSSAKRIKETPKELLILPDTIYYKPNGRGALKEWSYILSPDEHVNAIATGSKLGQVFAAVATTLEIGEQHSHRLHIFDCESGLQQSVTLLPGFVISMVGQRDNLFVVYADASNLLRYQVIHIKNAVSHSNIDGTLPISDAKQLKWIGISSIGFPAIQTPDMVCIFSPQLSAWIPVTTEPLPKNARVLYLSDQKIFYVRSNDQGIPTGAQEHEKDITLPFCEEQSDRPGSLQKKDLLSFLWLHLSSRQRDACNLGEDYVASDRMLFSLVYDLVADKKDFDSIAFLLQFLKLPKTMETLKRQGEKFKVNLDPIFARKLTEQESSAPSIATQQPQQLQQSANNQQQVDLLQQQVTKLQDQMSLLLERQQQQQQYSKSVVEKKEPQPTQPIIISPEKPLNSITLSNLMEDSDKDDHAMSESPGLFSPKRPKRSKSAITYSKDSSTNSDSKQTASSGKEIIFAKKPTTLTAEQKKKITSAPSSAAKDDTSKASVKKRKREESTDLEEQQSLKKLKTTQTKLNFFDKKK